MVYKIHQYTEAAYFLINMEASEITTSWLTPPHNFFFPDIKSYLLLMSQCEENDLLLIFIFAVSGITEYQLSIIFTAY